MSGRYLLVITYIFYCMYKLNKFINTNLSRTVYFYSYYLVKVRLREFGRNLFGIYTISTL